MFLISNNVSKKIYNFLFYLTSLIIIFYPTNNNTLFDGLAFDKKFEIFLICFFLPFLFLIKIKINKLIKFLIYIILFLKILFIYLPNNGILYNQYIINDSNTKEVKNVDFIFKQKNNKFILNKSLNKYAEFPIEWINYINPFNSNVGPNCHLTEIDCNKLVQDVINYKIKFIFNSNIYLSQDSKIFFITDGVIKYDLKIYNKKNEYKLDLFSQKVFDHSELPIIPRGNYKFHGFIELSGDQYKFLPTIIINDQIYNAFKKDIFFQEKVSNTQFQILLVIKFIFNFITILLISILSLLTFSKIFNRLKFREYFFSYISSFIFIISIFILSRFYTYDNLFNNFFNNLSINKILSGTFYLALYISIQILILIFLNIKKRLKNIEIDQIILFFKTFIILITLIYFFVFNFENLTYFQLHSQGDDWWIFEYFSYRILVLEEYLRAGEDIFYFRPLSRYVSALNHLFFGQSFFIHTMIDIWSILMSGFFTILILNKFSISKFLTFLVPIFIILLYFGETFKLLIGRGMPEYLSSVLLLSSSYFLIKFNDDLKIKNILIISLALVLGIWLREDHIFVSLTLILLSLNIPKTTNIVEIFLTILSKYKSKVLLFFFLISFGFSLLFIRNYIVSEKFLATNVHPNFGSSDLDGFISIYRILTGSPLENLPRTFSIFNIIAIIFSSIFIFSKKINKEILIFSIIIVSIVSPYIFLINWGYFPRFSIHLLPYSLIFICLIFKYRNLSFNSKLMKRFK